MTRHYLSDDDVNYQRKINRAVVETIHPAPIVNRRRTLGGGAAESPYRGGFMVSISEEDGVRSVHIHDYLDPEYAGFFYASSYTFDAYDEPLPGYGKFIAWARCENPRGRRFLCEVLPDNYPIINQYNRVYVKLAEITSTEEDFSVKQIFKDDRIYAAGMNFPYYLPGFMIDGTVTETPGGYQVSFRMVSGMIEHGIGYESTGDQNIELPEGASYVNVYVLYKRSSRGAQIKVYDRNAELHEAYSYLSEYRLQHIATIYRSSSSYSIAQTITGQINTTPQYARSGSFDLHAVCEISEQTGQSGVVLTETVTGWILESFYPDDQYPQRKIRYNQNQSISLPIISGTFDGSNQYRYVALKYDPATGQYSAEWTDHLTGDVYTWEHFAFSASGTPAAGNLYWGAAAPNFQDGEFYVRDRWQ